MLEKKNTLGIVAQKKKKKKSKARQVGRQNQLYQSDLHMEIFIRKYQRESESSENLISTEAKFLHTLFLQVSMQSLINCSS
jgi:hypothetical protein